MSRKIGVSNILCSLALFQLFELSALSAAQPQPLEVAPGANLFVNLAKKSIPSVVNISTLSRVKMSNQGEEFRKFWEHFFRGQPGGPPFGQDEPDRPEGEEKSPKQKRGPKAMALGSGFVIESSGLILTNNHVVADADEIKIYFTEETNEKPTDGEVVGRDPELDLALIRVKTKRELIALTLGDSDKLEVGEYVLAVGNPIGHGHSVTHGIISAKNRKSPEFALGKYLQTDAPINPGNSGGPLLNLRGEVIGINNAIDARAQGIGFAIPSNLVSSVLPQLKTKGTVARGYIGVLVNDLTPEIAEQIGLKKDDSGAFVSHVYLGEPADKAGLKPYDVIIEAGNKKISSSSELIESVTSVPVGESIQIKYLRNGKTSTTKLKVTERPSAKKMAGRGPVPEKDKKERKSKVNTGLKFDPEGNPAISGALVSYVEEDSPAEKAGLMPGDIIVEVNRKVIKDSDQFLDAVDTKKSYLLRVSRGGKGPGAGFIVVVLDLTE